MTRHSPTDPIIPVTNGHPSETRLIDHFQRQIDDGSIWRMPGRSARLAHELIEAGLCTLGPTSHRDCYGHRVPSRDEFEEDGDE